jgi:predicted AlkP superfamily phosphohydrolase/phosphomutase
MGLNYSKRFHGNNWLRAHGWLAAERKETSLNSPDRWANWLGLPRDKVGRMVYRLPGVLRSRIVRQVKQAVESRSLGVDAQRSQAYCIPMYNHVMGIRINLNGEAKEALRHEIIRELEKLVDPENGKKVVEEVHLGEDYYVGPYTDGVPDIVVILDPDYDCSPRLGQYSSPVTRLQVPPDEGGHRMEGIFIASGPGIAARPEALPDMDIEDVAPTALHLMDLPIPEDMDGRVLAEIFEPDVLKSHPIHYGRPTGFWPNDTDLAFNDAAMSPEDDTEIRRRLQALGYLE